MQRMPACQPGIHTHLIYDVIESLVVQVNVRVICHERDQEALELGPLNGTRLANVVQPKCNCRKAHAASCN
jgi:hypothetical protein